jgi:putative hydroxymethylpyrimidine transport system substrate-binding protein
MAIGWVLSLLLVLLSGCGSGGDRETTGAGDRKAESARQPGSEAPQSHEKLKQISVTLDGYADADNVGILMADQRGFFSDAGLDVEVLTPIITANVAGYVAQGIDELGALPQPDLVRARDRGMPLVGVGSLLSRSTTAMIWLKGSGIDSVADLRGKTIAVNGLPAEEDLLDVALGQAGLTRDDVEVKALGYLLVPALVKGRADAVFGVSGNVEGVELAARGLDPVVTPVRRLGIPPFEDLVVITRRDRLAEDPGSIRAFMSAVTRGTAAAIADPEAAAEAIADARTRIGYAEPQGRELVEAKLGATLPLLSRTGRMSPARADRLVAWMRDQGLVGADG